MAWRTLSTSESVHVDVDVDLDEFTEEQLLQGLIDADWLTEKEAEAIRARNRTTTARQLGGTVLDKFIDPDELDLAEYEVRAGRKSEGIIHLERALGRDWIGRLQS